MNSDNFYSQIESFSRFTQFTDTGWFRKLPAEWYVVISDIEDSTTAVQNGLYKEVNSISTASITVMLNAISPLQVPYVFGGDGATMCIPPSRKPEVESALIAARLMARSSFSLNLRVGMVAVSEIEKAGHQVLVGKFQPSTCFQQAMFQGNGLRFAESLVKSAGPENRYLLNEEAIVPNGNFEGFECRWNEIPSSREETVAIIVQAVERRNPDADKHESKLYQMITDRIESIYGEASQHHPLHPDQLRLSLSPSKLSIEARIRTAFQSSLNITGYLVKSWLATLAGKILMARKIQSSTVNWGNYKSRLIENTDYRKFDEILRMVISGTRENRRDLTQFLESLHKEGKIVFGMHASPAAVITCMVSDYNTDHIHFLDGSNGGYAMAAQRMKQQILNMNHSSNGRRSPQ